MKTAEKTKTSKNKEATTQKKSVRKDSDIADYPGKNRSAGLLEKIEKVVEENEDTVQFILEIAALSIKKSNMTEKNKRIAKAALVLISEIIGTEEEVRKYSRLGSN